VGKSTFEPVKSPAAATGARYPKQTAESPTASPSRRMRRQTPFKNERRRDAQAQRDFPLRKQRLADHFLRQSEEGKGSQAKKVSPIRAGHTAFDPWKAEEIYYGSMYLQPVSRRARATRLPFDEGPAQSDADADLQPNRKAEVITSLVHSLPPGGSPGAEVAIGYYRLLGSPSSRWKKEECIWSSYIKLS